jgi:hypothetical protein
MVLIGYTVWSQRERKRLQTAAINETEHAVVARPCRCAVVIQTITRQRKFVFCRKAPALIFAAPRRKIPGVNPKFQQRKMAVPRDFGIWNLIFGIFSFGAVAQLVEQRTENPCVGGSIPPHTTALKSRWKQRGFFCLHQ